MTVLRRRRRRIDLVVAAVIALMAVAITAVVYLGSDVRATALTTAAGSGPPIPESAERAPQQLRQIWQLSTNPQYGALATPYGSVVTADTHSVSGFDARDGSPLWQYVRENRTLCAIGSGDTHPDSLTAWTGVHGVMTLFSKNGYCSQVTLLNPSTGERLYQRTSPNQDPGELFFGAPYVGWLGTDYLELWRHDLVATIRYGDQPNPVNSSGPHVGCEFTDAAATADQLATIEHCGSGAQLVLHWPTPSDAPDNDDHGWDANHSEPKATIALDSDDAVILAVTADRAAVLVSQPEPSIAVYNSAGEQISRDPIDIPANAITRAATAGITPATVYDGVRYTVVGDRLFAFGYESITEPAPPTPDVESPDGDAGEDSSSASSAEGAGSDVPPDEPEMIAVDSPILQWMARGVLGLPTRVGDAVLAPTAGALLVLSAIDGTTESSIDVDRGAYIGRVDVSAVGPVLVEIRGEQVVGLAAAD